MLQTLMRVGCEACKAMVRQITKPATYCNVQQIRMTCVFEHENYIPPRCEGVNPKIDDNYKLLKLTINKNCEPRPDIQCLLTDYVDELGFPGEVVAVPRRIFRHELYPLGLAVYPTPENIAEVKEKLQATGQLEMYKNFTPYTRRILREIAGLHLPIPMNAKNEWTLNKNHVKVALRNVNVEVTDEDCIELPESPVTRPGEIILSITLNKSRSVKFKATVYNIGEGQPEINQIWDNPHLEHDEFLLSKTG